MPIELLLGAVAIFVREITAAQTAKDAGQPTDEQLDLLRKYGQGAHDELADAVKEALARNADNTAAKAREAIERDE
jgi:hypothetical protein